MLRMISLFICWCSLSSALYGQQTLSSKEMVAITPVLSRSIDLPAHAQKTLGNKLSQIATQNGFGSVSGEFVLTANTLVVDKQMTATAPVRFVVELEVSLYVLNVLEGTVIDEMSVVVKGIDTQDHKAIIQAINQIKPKSSEIRRFMEECRVKLIEYYNTRIPTLLAKANSLAERFQYEEALMVLSAIPEMVDQYPTVADQMVAICTKMLDREATIAIQEAKSKIAQKDYEAALDALAAVDPASTKSKEAFDLIESIKKSIDEKEAAEMAEKLQRYEDSKEAALRAYDDKVALEKMRIEAARKVGVETAKTQASVSEGVNKWFLGKFR